jgi:chromosome transmission fidelity protein 18
MFADGDFALLPYLPFALVPFYPLFQARSSERIERNYSDWEVCKRFLEPGKPFTFLEF